MPGQLKKDAKCPLCEAPLDALVDTTNSDGVQREYLHVHARRPRCKQFFVSHVKAHLERHGLERHARQ